MCLSPISVIHDGDNFYRGASTKGGTAGKGHKKIHKNDLDGA